MANLKWPNCRCFKIECLFDQNRQSLSILLGRQTLADRSSLLSPTGLS